MLSSYKTKTNLYIGCGILLQIARAFIFGDSPLGELLGVGGAILFLVGCCCYAKAKGHHAAWGLLGLLSILGLIILICFRDRNK